MKLNNLTVLIVVTLFYVIESKPSKLDSIDIIKKDIELPDHCNSPIYCNGELLHTVQLSKIFEDSKTFVDMYQKHDENVILANFKKLMKEVKGNPNQKDVKKFVDENFSDVDVLEKVDLKDWSENPAILSRIKDHVYMNWIKELNNLWKTLARRIISSVQENPKRYSILYANNAFIIPGGRFKEYYYWDSYWIIEGLLITGLQETAKGMIQNFLSMVDTYGFVPNGGRVYYLMRSQPPLLSLMVHKFYEVTKDKDFMLAALPRLEAEFNYWYEKKTVTITKGSDRFLMARYLVTSLGPRPESYREDYDTYKKLDGDARQKHFYENIKAGAETGWDFSSRWLSDNGAFTSDLEKIDTSNIIPVDLNAFLERSARILSEFYSIQGNQKKSKEYEDISLRLQKAIESILWNEADGTWYDFNINTKRQNDRFYGSNLTPLYTQSYNIKEMSAEYGKRAVQYLYRMDVIKIGGIPTSLDKSGQQWDFPNAWAPLISIVVQGLRNADYEPAKDLSKHIASLWLRTNYEGFNSNKVMYEKYDAERIGQTGGGGEYVPQTGFGWTNGVALEFLDTYPDIKSEEQMNTVIMN